MTARYKARLAGIFYFLVFVTGVLSLPASALLVQGDAMATAANIYAHEPIYVSGFAALLINVVCYVVVTALFYRLFRVVSGTVSLTAALVSLVGCAVQASMCVLYIAPLTYLNGQTYLNVFTPVQLQSLAYVTIRLYSQGYDVGLVFFGFYCVLIGALIVRSTFIPKTFGILMVIAGLGWLTFLTPQLATAWQPWNLLPGVIGEGALTLWLLFKGVDEQRWQEQAVARAAGSTAA